jgi:hypothetical protein
LRNQLAGLLILVPRTSLGNENIALHMGRGRVRFESGFG